MFRNNANDKKNTLLAQKEKLLQEIQCYEKKIDEFSNKSSNVYFGADSSDSDSGFPTYLDIGPSISELKRQDRLLKTCLQATQELTSVTVLESEVQILVKNPDIGSEKPVSEQGVWREVTAECRLDLVPFTILFYVHQPSRCFSASCYRGVRVSPVKAAQAAELAGSVLHSLTTPADVLETVRSYAVAYRSRRGSLARLADRYASALYMQPREEGGFVLRCGSVMQMVWRLENKISPLAHFQHKMSFELEYMDESFLKIIKQAHRQLSDPSLQTDERTQLLSKIISTCIEAQGQDNMESDTDSRKLEKTTLDDDDDGGDDDGDGNVEERDKEVMAPPKAIPKRTKPKGKENDDGNRKSVKRNAEQIDVSVKKARTDVDVTDSINASENDAINSVIVDITHKSKVTGRLDDNPGNENDKNNAKTSQVNPSDKKLPKKITKTGQDKESVSDPKKKKNDEEKKTQENKLKSVRNSEVNKNHKENHEKAHNQVIEQSRQSDKITVNSKNVKNVKNNSDGSKTSRTNQAQTDEKSSGTFQATKITKESKLKKAGNLNVNTKIVVDSKTSKSKKTGTLETINNKNTNSHSNTKKIAPDTDIKTDNQTEPKNKGIKTNSNNAKVVSSNKTAKPGTDNAKKTGDDNANGKQTLKSETENVKPVNSKKTVTTSGDSMKRRESDLADSDSANNKKVAVTDITHKKVSNDHDIAKKSGNTTKPTKTAVVKPANAKIVNNETEKNKKSVNSNNTVKQVENSDPNCNKMNSKINTIFSKNDAKLTNVTVNSKNPSKDIKTKMVIKNHRNSSGKATKKLSAKPSLGKESKIPQKKLSPAYAAVLKQNPVRISPRMLSKFKSPSDSNIQSKLFKPVTNIPRLMKKPAPKSK